jgi:tricorn protease
LLSLTLPGLADSAYVRQPDLFGDRLVFCAEADLWTAALDGSDVRRITTHAGTESSPCFSPDGEKIAFSASYDGNQDVYVIAARGGEPRRLTWHPGGDEVIGWTPDGAAVLFRSRRDDPMGSQRIYRVELTGGDPFELPLGWAARLDIDPATGAWAFTRNNRENRPWKRYRGGLASDIWIGDPERADFHKLTDFAGNDQFPMWHGGRIWFLSDQGGTENLWSIAPDGADRRQHTSYDTWDIRWPAMSDDGRIVFTLAADVHIFDPRSGLVDKVEIDLQSDAVMTRVRYPDAGKTLTEFDITQKGDRLAVVSRGEVFSVPVEEGVTLPITRGTSTRERSVAFDPRGERILFVTDESGEEEVRTIDAWGRGAPSVVLPAREGVWHYQPRFSPEGAWLAFADDSYGLFVMPAKGGAPVEIARGSEGELTTYAWSPGGRWLAYDATLRNGFSSIFLYDTEEQRTHAVTGPHTDDRSPTWDPDGRYLYFVSSREINPLIDELDFNNVEVKNDKLYAVLLRKDVENPLLERAGLPLEEGQDAQEKGDSEEEPEEQDAAPKRIEIDVTGLAARVVELPVPMGNFAELGATSTHLFYVDSPVRGLVEAGDFFTPGDLSNKLMFFDLAKHESSVFSEGIQGYLLANGGQKIAVHTPGGLFVVSSATAPGSALAEGAVDLTQMVVELDPRLEWAQIFRESWRQMREFYWDEGLSGIDWEAIRDQYASLLPRLSSRADLSDLLGQVFGEMNTSHTYVMGGGDSGPGGTRVSTGLLGADLLRHADHAYRVTRIYRGADPERLGHAALRGHPVGSGPQRLEAGATLAPLSGLPESSSRRISALPAGESVVVAGSSRRASRAASAPRSSGASWAVATSSSPATGARARKPRSPKCEEPRFVTNNAASTAAATAAPVTSAALRSGGAARRTSGTQVHCEQRPQARPALPALAVGALELSTQQAECPAQARVDGRDRRAGLLGDLPQTAPLEEAQQDQAPQGVAQNRPEPAAQIAAHPGTAPQSRHQRLLHRVLGEVHLGGDASGQAPQPDHLRQELLGAHGILRYVHGDPDQVPPGTWVSSSIPEKPAHARNPGCPRNRGPARALERRLPGPSSETQERPMQPTHLPLALLFLTAPLAPRLLAQTGPSATGAPLSSPATRSPFADWMPWEYVGDPGNPPSPFGPGSVAAPYFIGKYEVTNRQYAELLDAKAALGDPFELYNPQMGLDPVGGIVRSGSGTPSDPYIYRLRPEMGAKPVNFVSFYDALRFANWMHNGRGDGDTETGAYTLVGGTAVPQNGTTVLRDPGARIVIPTEHEWYKAGHYRPSNSAYSKYATGSNLLPTPATATSTGEIANPGPDVVNYLRGADWAGQDGHVTTVGSGGDYRLDESIMLPGHFGIVLPHHEASTIGFRVAGTVP